MKTYIFQDINYFVAQSCASQFVILETILLCEIVLHQWLFVNLFYIFMLV